MIVTVISSPGFAVPARTIGILGMGDMGSAVSRILRQAGYDVVTALDGRSALSRELAAGARVRDLGSVDAVLAAADLLLSILPPARAFEFAETAAREIRRRGHRLVYVDCNAVSPDTVTAMAALFGPGPARFVDAGIVGAAPQPGTTVPTRFYVAGPERRAVLDLAAPELELIDMGDGIGRASALKMCYGALNKGTDALWTAILMAAERLGVRQALMRDFERSLPDFARRMHARLPFHAATASRFTGEMREISATLEQVGVTGDFHRGAEWLFARLAESAFAGESRATLPAERSLDEAIAAFVAVPERCDEGSA
jgi:3-hydroxyisobutyrate dehydrogenase-like beta-hydroxyacid dehydrogenase